MPCAMSSRIFIASQRSERSRSESARRRCISGIESPREGRCAAARNASEPGGPNMSDTRVLDRRDFLHGVGIAAGAAGLAPAIVATPAAAAAEAPPPQLPPYTARLAEFVAGLRYEQIPVDVVQRVKDCIVDTVGVILYGSRFPWSKTVIAYARANG